MNSIHDPRVTGKDGRISKGGTRGRRDLAPNDTGRRFKATRRHGIARPPAT
jgi:hypothetical protein